MDPQKRQPRRRIGQVSLYRYHGAWYTYHRAGGEAVRRCAGRSESEAELEASLVNAQLIRNRANLTIDSKWATALGLLVPPSFEYRSVVLARKVSRA